MNGRDKLQETAMAIAATIADPDSDRTKALSLALSMVETIKLASTALSVASIMSENQEKRIIPEPFTPASYLRELADMWEQQVGEENLHQMVEELRDREVNRKMEQINLPEDFGVNDILGEG